MKDQFLNIDSARIIDGVKKYVSDESGATAVEYGLLAALIGIMTITGANALGGNLDDTFKDIAILMSGPADEPLSDAPPPPPASPPPPPPVLPQKPG